MAKRVEPTVRGTVALGAALRGSRDRARGAAERNRGDIPLGDAPALLCDPEGLVVAANAAAAELAAVASADVFIGRSLQDLIVGPDSAPRLRRLDTTDLPVRLARWPVPGSDLDVVLLVDVSDLAGAADALLDEQRRLGEVQTVARIGSWEYDPATGQTLWSQTHYEILGLEPGSVLPGGEAMLDIIHPDDHDRVSVHWRDHYASGKPIDIEYRVVLPDGDIRRLRAEAKAQRNERNEIVRITGYIRDITERWRTNTELAQERARLVEAQRIAKMGSWTYEVSTGVTYRSEVLNEMYAGIGGFLEGSAPPPEYPEHTALDQLYTKVHSELMQAEDGETVEIEIEDTFAERILISRTRAERGPSGKVERVLGTVQDVTEQRALERELRDERRQLDEAQRVARLGTWQWHQATDEVIWSPMLNELTGVPREEQVTFQSFLDLVHPDDVTWFKELWSRLDKEPVECEHRIVRRDGSVRVFRCHGAMLTSDGGMPVIVGTAQDITEIRAFETKMERTSQRFTDLVAVTPVGIGLLDDTGRLVDANNALCDLFGYALESIRGLTADELTHPDDRARWSECTAKMTASQQTSYKIPQKIMLRADGEPIYCELHIALSVQDDGHRFWLVVFQDITERRRTAEALRHQATHDELTGLPNRAAVNEMLGKLLRSADRQKVAVLFCDIDNFKRVNDSLGHDAGDELLVALARRLEGGLPPRCTAARLSGDEYVIICEDIDSVGGVEALAAKVASLLRTAVPVHDQLLRVSASIGAAVPNGSRVTGADLLRFADAAMFEAKRRGAGRVSQASPALMASADHQVQLEGQLRDALSRDGLTLHFQPVVGPDGVILTAEALVRWPHPDRGLLTPDVFLPIAEQGDLLRELDRWVLRTALREAVAWPCPEDRPVAIAVNLAGLVPGDPDFVDTVANAVAETGIDWDRVVLELVETALVDLPSRTRQAMRVLVERGVRFAVDDFGTGYSSLARLKELPAQIVKVDRQFVAGVDSDSSDLAVARAVVDMSRAMGRSCVAEGVETATQFHVLRGVGVDAYQGWLFSRAVPSKEFHAMVRRGPLQVPRAG